MAYMNVMHRCISTGTNTLVTIVLTISNMPVTTRSMMAYSINRTIQTTEVHTRLMANTEYVV